MDLSTDTFKGLRWTIILLFVMSIYFFATWKNICLRCTMFLISYFSRDILMMPSTFGQVQKKLFNCFLQNFYLEIKITPSISSISMDLLDIIFFKGEIYSSSAILSTQWYWMCINTFLLTPSILWTKKKYVINEPKKYLLQESNLVEYIHLCNQLFWRRLAINYPTKFLHYCFKSISSEYIRVTQPNSFKDSKK